MTARLRNLEPAEDVVQVPPLTRKGRPRGSIGPLAMLLGPQIARYKAQGAGCVSVFRSLSVVEGGDSKSFDISAETAEAYYPEIGFDLTGTKVTLWNFQKMWRRF